MLSHVWLFATPWTVAHQAPLSKESSRQEYWSGLPFPPSEDLPNPETEPASLASPALAGWFFTTAPSGLAYNSRERARNQWYSAGDNDQHSLPLIPSASITFTTITRIRPKDLVFLNSFLFCSHHTIIFIILTWTFKKTI